MTERNHRETESIFNKTEYQGFGSLGIFIFSHFSVRKTTGSTGGTHLDYKTVETQIKKYTAINKNHQFTGGFYFELSIRFVLPHIVLAHK